MLAETRNVTVLMIVSTTLEVGSGKDGPKAKAVAQAVARVLAVTDLRMRIMTSTPVAAQ